MNGAWAAAAEQGRPFQYEFTIAGVFLVLLLLLEGRLEVL